MTHRLRQLMYLLLLMLFFSPVYAEELSEEAYTLSEPEQSGIDIFGYKIASLSTAFSYEKYGSSHVTLFDLKSALYNTTVTYNDVSNEVFELHMKLNDQLFFTTNLQQTISDYINETLYSFVLNLGVVDAQSIYLDFFSIPFTYTDAYGSGYSVEEYNIFSYIYSSRFVNETEAMFYGVGYMGIKSTFPNTLLYSEQVDANTTTKTTSPIFGDDLLETDFIGSEASTHSIVWTFNLPLLAPLNSDESLLLTFRMFGAMGLGIYTPDTTRASAILTSLNAQNTTAEAETSLVLTQMLKFYPSIEYTFSLFDARFYLDAGISSYIINVARLTPASGYFEENRQYLSLGGIQQFFDFSFSYFFNLKTQYTIDF